jgi:hypothetical protein
MAQMYDDEDSKKKKKKNEQQAGKKISDKANVFNGQIHLELVNKCLYT